MMALENFLSHQAPMLFLNELIESGDDYAIAKVKVSRDLILATDLGLPTWTTMELMAQTISLYSGLQWSQKGCVPRIGFLLGTKNIHFDFPFFALGSELMIKVTKQYRHKSIWFFDCELTTQQHKINAVLHVYESSDEE